LAGSFIGKLKSTFGRFSVRRLFCIPSHNFCTCYCACL